MRRQFFVAAALVMALALGAVFGRLWPSEDSAPATTSTVGEREILYWVAPMDRNYRRDKPGKSPMGMDLTPVYADTLDAVPGVVTIDATMVSNLGVRTQTALRGPLPRRITTVGYVGYDEDSIQQVATRVDGWIEKLAVRSVGEPVRRGQMLFELYSPTLVNAQQEYLAVLSSSNSALQKAGRARLAALGLSGDAIDRLTKTRQAQQRSQIYAPVDGVVAQLGVRDGAYVSPSSSIMAIADLAEVWVIAEVLERQASWLVEGLSAEIELNSLPGELLRGAVDYIYPTLDPITRTLRVRLRLPNPNAALRPNMLASVDILGISSRDVVHVPRQAVIRGGAVDRVVLALGRGRFRSQPVELGTESGDRTVIRRGLSAGDEVVTSAQFLIDSESNIDSALARFTSQRDAGGQMDHNEMDNSEMGTPP
jgi:Cu(I)/Ag(I) efflux system membrane fusion protein